MQKQSLMTNSKFFFPDRFLKQVLPTGFWYKKILTRDVDPKKAVIKEIVHATTVSKRELDGTYRRAIQFYDKKIARLKDEGVRAYKSEALDDEKLLKSRIANLVIYNEVQELRKERKGQRYRWLPSGALEPRPEHQLNYGKIFTVGDGEMPGEAYGCQCGIEWIDD